MAVLVMDDDESMLELCRLMLGKAGFEVTLTREGNEAVASYRRALEIGRPFAVVLLDVNIPGGKGGKETLAELRALDPTVRAFVSSGCPDDPLMVNWREHGFAGAIEKPQFYLLPRIAERLRALAG
jgi:DNA-binding response OmpR family regulator